MAPIMSDILGYSVSRSFIHRQFREAKKDIILELNNSLQSDLTREQVDALVSDPHFDEALYDVLYEAYLRELEEEENYNQ